MEAVLDGILDFEEVVELMPESERKVRIGVIVATLGRKDHAALKLAILRINTLQTFAEFEVVDNLPYDTEFLSMARSGKTFDRDRIGESARLFQQKVETMAAMRFEGTREQFVCDRYIAACNMSSNDNFYLLTTGSRLRLLLVAEWSRMYAPPSLLEFIVFHTIKQAVREAFGNIDSHLSTRGCLFDFNRELVSARYSVLVGHICDDCKTVLPHQSDDRWRELESLLGGRWLGDPSDPLSTYCELERLGFRVFQASGVKDSWFDKFLAVSTSKLAEETAKYVMLALALYLALSFGLDELVTSLK